MSLPSLTIDTGVVRLCINGDPERVIEFNPHDAEFAEKLYELEQEYLRKDDEFRKKATALDAAEETDKLGVPLNAAEKLAFQRELGDWVRERIDNLFGAETSQTVFGNVNSLAVFSQFFEGVSPYIESAREEKMNKHIDPVLERRKQIEAEKAEK